MADYPSFVANVNVPTDCLYKECRNFSFVNGLYIEIRGKLSYPLENGDVSVFVEITYMPIWYAEYVDLKKFKSVSEELVKEHFRGCYKLT